jgi:hypothetical protein
LSALDYRAPSGRSVKAGRIKLGVDCNVPCGGERSKKYLKRPSRDQIVSLDGTKRAATW